MRARVLWLTGLILIGGCATIARRAPPPSTISAAEPEGYSVPVRLVTTDLGGFADRAPAFAQGIRRAAAGRPVNILALSGGGSSGAFGAGALVGLSQAHARPRFELVTGVSAGAIIAPFAFLGPAWDARLEATIRDSRRHPLVGSVGWRFAQLLLAPLGWRGHDPLLDLVDRHITPAMLRAVARASAKGRRLIVATTDLDSQQTVLWDMGAIAARGGPRALELFRKVIAASASVPGVFPPVLIEVHEGERRYDELHVDGGVTTPVFIFPLVAGLRPRDLAPLRGADVYVIINGKLASAPMKTPINTINVFSRSISAGITSATRAMIVEAQGIARQMDMRLRVTQIPPGFPSSADFNFGPRRMRALFSYGERCAARGLLWMTPTQANMLNMKARSREEPASPACPAVAAATAR